MKVGINELYRLIANGDLSDPTDRIIAADGDPNVLRPWVGTDGKSYVTKIEINKAGEEVGVPVHVANAHATLRVDDWKAIDDAVVKAAVPRLKLVNSLRGAGLTFNIPQGMGKTVLQTETQSDINDAVISMDGVRESPNDRPEFEASTIPLPITHKDFQFSARQILASRNGGSPLDTTMAELCGRKIAESNERLALGSLAAYTYAGGTLYGLTNFPSRMTRVINTPTGAATDGANLLADVMAMILQSTNAYHYGPWKLFNSPNWTQYLAADFKAASDKTIRQRISEVDGISEIMTLDYLTNYDLVLMQTTTDVVRLVIGLDLTTLQWDTKGGMQKNFKVLDIIVPQLRADFNSRTGIVHGSVA